MPPPSKIAASKPGEYDRTLNPSNPYAKAKRSLVHTKAAVKDTTYFWELDPHRPRKYIKNWWQLRFFNPKPTDQLNFIRKRLQWYREQGLTGQCVPHPDVIWKPLELCPFKKVRVVIVSETARYTSFDHTNKYSMELIHELERDLGFKTPNYKFNLEQWMKRGVLFIPMCWIRRENKLALKSYWYSLNWWLFYVLSHHTKYPLVFIFIGRKSTRFLKYVDQEKHHVIKVSGPNPYRRKGSYSQRYRSLQGSRIFSRTCKLLNLPHYFWSIR